MLRNMVRPRNFIDLKYTRNIPRTFFTRLPPQPHELARPAGLPEVASNYRATYK
jgi:hypothetical protein